MTSLNFDDTILYLKIITRVLAHNNTTEGGESPDNFLLTQMPFLCFLRFKFWFLIAIYQK